VNLGQTIKEITGEFETAGGYLPIPSTAVPGTKLQNAKKIKNTEGTISELPVCILFPKQNRSLRLPPYAFLDNIFCLFAFFVSIILHRIFFVNTFPKKN